MSKVIKISNDTWKRLKRRAEPLDDNPNDVVSRVLDEAAGYRANSHRLQSATVKCPECERVLSIDDAGFKRCPSCDPYEYGDGYYDIT
jgi:hypothetical protein